MKTIICLFGCLFGSILFADSASPNIVLILADDQGWNALYSPTDPDVVGSKSDFYQTPNTDRLLGEGMCFTDAYAPAPVCSPTRHSIQFGISPAKTRVTHNDPQHKQFCDPNLAIPNLIKKADSRYVTAHFGKWHVSVSPEDCGYDESDGDTGNREGSNSKSKEDPKRTFEVTDRAVDFLDRTARTEQPFFLQVSYYADHLTFKSNPKTLEKYKNQPKGERHSDPVFAGMNEDLDTGVGQILEAIDRLGISDDTYVIYTADNGYDESPRKLHGNPRRKAWPLSYSKGFVFEGGIRVPFIVRGPGIKAGSISRAPVVGYDLMPTILNWIDPAFELPEIIEGGSLLTVLANGGRGSIERSNDFLLFHYPTGVWPAQSSLRQGDFKIVKTWAFDRVELFDLRYDRSESKDLSQSIPERADAMHTRMMDYLDSVNTIYPPEQELAFDRQGLLMKKAGTGWRSGN